MSLAGILRVKLLSIEVVIQCLLSESLVVALRISTGDKSLCMPHINGLLAVLNPDVNRCTIIILLSNELGCRSPIQFLFLELIFVVVSFRIALHKGHLLGYKTTLISNLGSRVLQKVSLSDLILLRG